MSPLAMRRTLYAVRVAPAFVAGRVLGIPSEQGEADPMVVTALGGSVSVFLDEASGSPGGWSVPFAVAQAVATSSMNW
jgi:hypothetical protein